MSSLINIKIVPPNEAIIKEYNLKDIPEEIPFEFEFYISSVTHGCGRSSADRQFFYINSRPCEPNKIMKLVNEIYKQFNGNQYPFVYLNVMMSRNQIDVNVTPDKRQVFLNQEKLLLATIKSSLLASFKDFPSIYQCQNMDIGKSFIKKESPENERGMKRTKEDDEKESKRFSLDRFKNVRAIDTRTTSDQQEKKRIKMEIESSQNCNKNLDALVHLVKEESIRLTEENQDVSVIKETESKIVCKYGTDKSAENTVTVCKLDLDAFRNKSPMEPITKKIKTEAKSDSDPVENKSKPTACELDRDMLKSRKTIIWDVNLNDIETSLEKKSKCELDNSMSIKFRSKIAPSSNEEAERELQKNFHKESFKNVDIIGQFNLAFIIGKLKNDLFIIDQHASDEKYNFEQLQLTTVLENQELIK